MCRCVGLNLFGGEKKGGLPEKANTPNEGQHLRSVRHKSAVLHPPGDMHVTHRLGVQGSAADVPLPRQLLHHW